MFGYKLVKKADYDLVTEELWDDIDGVVLSLDTLEDRVDDLEGDLATLEGDLADSDYSTVKFMKSQRLINQYFLDRLEGIIDGQRELAQTVEGLIAPKTGDGTTKKKSNTRTKK